MNRHHQPSSTVAPVLAAALIVIGSAADLRAGDWTRFRGPNGTGISTDDAIPVEFGPDKNLAWKVALPGGGHGSPVVAAGRVYLQAAEKGGNGRTLVAYDLADGKEKWRRTFPGTTARTHKKNSLASGTPAVDGKGVYVVVWDGAALTLEATTLEGKPSWSVPLGKFAGQHGAGASPMVVAGRVVVNVDQDGAAEVVAVDAASGKVSWRKTRKAYRTCYSTPIVLDRGQGTDPLVVVGSTAGLTAYEPSSGAEAWNWVWDWSDSRAPLRTVAGPVAGDGLIFLNAGDGAGDRAAVAVKPGTSGSSGKEAVAWSDKRTFPYVPTMIVDDGHLFFVNDRGIAGCSNAKDGKSVWVERLGGDVSASPVLAGGRIYAPDEKGTVHVFAAAVKFQRLAANNVGEPIFASPAVADGRLLIRGDAHLFCFAKK